MRALRLLVIVIYVASTVGVPENLGLPGSGCRCASEEQQSGNCCCSAKRGTGSCGGSAEKPVGTVCFGWAQGQKMLTTRVIFAGDREAVRQQSVLMALQGLLDLLEA